jgi:hypothetical protein
MLKTGIYQCRSQGQPMVLRVYLRLGAFLWVEQATNEAMSNMLNIKVSRRFQVLNKAD